MKHTLKLMPLAAIVATSWSARAQVLGGTSTSTNPVDKVLAILQAVPPPADDPMLDASGNVMYDSSGKPISDPDEKFHQVTPIQFDPDHTWLVQSAWLNGTGCPTGPTSLTGLVPCPTNDTKDQHNEGLLLAKTGPTTNNASAIAELKKVRGTTVTSLGYDIRKEGLNVSPLGSHCGAGAPRFNLVTSTGAVTFIGCNSPPPTTQETVSQGWQRLQWDVTPPVTVERIFILFDEGQDTGPDFFGAAFLDNIMVNGQMVGSGPTNAK